MAIDGDAPHEPMGRDLHEWSLDGELCLPVHVTQPPAEQQTALFDFERVLAFAARSSLFDREHIGEVRGDLQLDHCRHL